MVFFASHALFVAIYSFFVRSTTVVGASCLAGFPVALFEFGRGLCFCITCRKREEVSSLSFDDLVLHLQLAGSGLLSFAGDRYDRFVGDKTQ